MSIGAHRAYGVHGVHMVPVVSMVLMESCITFTPQGSVLFNYFSHGKLERSEGSSITEG